GTALGRAGTFALLPVREGIAALVPVDDKPRLPPDIGVAARAATEPEVTWLLATSTGMFKIVCSSARRCGGQRIVMSKSRSPSVICELALPPTAVSMTSPTSATLTPQRA